MINHLKGEKVTVFKKKRRKGYKVKNGFRASLTEIEIIKISEKADQKNLQRRPKQQKHQHLRLLQRRLQSKKKAVKKVAAKKSTKTTKK